MLPVWTLFLGYAPLLVTSAPAGVPTTGNALWYTSVGTNWDFEYLPVGNGYLAAMVPGGTYQDSTQLNIESLWSGGPFQDPTYNGGNPNASQQASIAVAVEGYRQAIFTNDNGTIDNVYAMMTDPGAYGSYSGAGYLNTNLNISGDISGYGRWLDLDIGVARSCFNLGPVAISRDTLCSHPAQACVQYTASNVTSTLSMSYNFGVLSGLPTPNITCYDSATLQVTGLVDDPGMAYEILARVFSSDGVISCSTDSTSSPPNSTISVTNASAAWIVWVGDTNYNMDAGDAAHNFSFLGPSPHTSLVSLLSASGAENYTTFLSTHTDDYTAQIGKFSLDLGQQPDLDTPTDELKAAYETYTGNPYLEWLFFNLGRHMIVSGARGTLPLNLQGKWADANSNSWGSDADINLEMFYWSVEMTNLNVTQSLFDYIQKTWGPRGSYTAEVVYNISSGFVTHDEMNIFGHTGMKLEGNSAEWADYPESNAWMMLTVWDHFDYTNDVVWWKSQGYPLLKSVASFHLQKLIPDERFNDGTLVVAPCNSPEQVPITLGCAHAQQLIFQLFSAIEKGYAAAGDDDDEFLAEIQTKRAQMDKGLRIGWWGQLQEWKVDMDQQNDTHRHLSHLVGLYPGYAISNYNPAIQGGLIVNDTHLNYTKQQVIDAAAISLIHRGNGTGPDADAGWEKIWRAACWAQLGNASEFYFEFTYAIERNFAANGFSIYEPNTPPFQIDANLGLVAATMNAIIQAPDVASLSIPLVVTLLPALPPNWGTGSFNGTRIRGAMTVDFFWADGKATNVTFTVDDGAPPREVEVVYQGEVIGAFSTAGGMVKSFTF